MVEGDVQVAMKQSMVRALVCVLVLAFVMMSSSASWGRGMRWSVEGRGLSQRASLLRLRSSGLFSLLGQDLGLKTEMLCKEAVVDRGSWIGGQHSGLLKMHFSRCKVAQPSFCSVVEPIESAVEISLFEEASALNFLDARVRLVPASEHRFFWMQLGGCVASGTFAIEGTQECELENSTSRRVSHLVSCHEEESTLSFAGKPSAFEGTFAIELGSRRPFGVV